MAHVEQELITLPEHSSSSRFLVAEFVLIALFFFWPLYFRSFFDVRLLITPLVSSNFFPSSLNTKKDYVIWTPIKIIETTFLKFMIQTPWNKRIRKKLLETTLLKPSSKKKSILYYQLANISCQVRWLKLFGTSMSHSSNVISYDVVLFCVKWARKKVWRYQRGNQKPYIEERPKIQWPEEKKSDQHELRVSIMWFPVAFYVYVYTKASESCIWEKLSQWFL
jgi:hypothetical protein